MSPTAKKICVMFDIIWAKRKPENRWQVFDGILRVWRRGQYYSKSKTVFVPGWEKVAHQPKNPQRAADLYNKQDAAFHKFISTH